MEAFSFDINEVQTPCYVIDVARLTENLRVLKAVSDESGCKILLAQKAFSAFALYPLVGSYLCGTSASGLYEARLGREEMGGEVHVFSPAYQRNDFIGILEVADHIVFNSFAQWARFGPDALAGGKSCGLRVNPMHSTQSHAIYDPCAPGSRLGVTRGQMRPEQLEGLEGFHFHTLCEQGADALESTLDAVERQFGAFFPRLKWLNMGGGHHITKPGYDIPRLISLIRRIQDRYGLTVYLEPGEAIALNAGLLVTTVIDTVENSGIRSAILDVSAACHMPDVLEMPYRPPVHESGEAGEKRYTYRLSGPTCLAGDIIGDYSFDSPLIPGRRVALEDMAIYTMVKNNTFNGTPLPSIYATEKGSLRLLRSFGYEDFKSRLS